jgi:hypothetical protein
MMLWRNNIEDGHCPSPGPKTTIRSYSVHDQNLAPFFLNGFSVLIIINNIKISSTVYELRTRTNLCAILLSGAYYAETWKSKNSTRKRNFKSKWTLCVETSCLSNDTKKHTTKSRETTPLILHENLLSILDPQLYNLDF